MPTYEYKCVNCGHFETFQSIKDDALTTCPTCTGAVKRLISRNVGIIYKGTGYYNTDNRSKSYLEKAKTEQDGSKGGESKDSKITEPKGTEATAGVETKGAETKGKESTTDNKAS